MYTFIRGINIHVCQPFVNLREMVADYVQLTKRPFLGRHTYRRRVRGQVAKEIHWPEAIKNIQALLCRLTPDMKHKSNNMSCLYQPFHTRLFSYSSASFANQSKALVRSTESSCRVEWIKYVKWQTFPHPISLGLKPVDVWNWATILMAMPSHLYSLTTDSYPRFLRANRKSLEICSRRSQFPKDGIVCTSETNIH